MCVCVCVCVGGGQHFFVEIYLITKYRRLLSIYFYFYPFKSPYGCL